MNIPGPATAFAVPALLALCACATTGEDRRDDSQLYEESTVRTSAPRCPAGLVLQCESRKVGRIRFGRIGNKNLENCACEPYQGMPTQSPVPGIQ